MEQQLIGQIMSSDLVCCDVSSTVADVARQMREHNVGDVLIIDGGRLECIVTDRDLVVRCLADGGGPDSPVARAGTREPCTTTPDTTIEDAAGLMRSHAVRRLPVVEAGAVVGIVSIGDLARHADPTSALASISAAPPDA